MTRFIKDTYDRDEAKNNADTLETKINTYFDSIYSHARCWIENTGYTNNFLIHFFVNDHCISVDPDIFFENLTQNTKNDILKIVKGYYNGMDNVICASHYIEVQDYEEEKDE